MQLKLLIGICVMNTAFQCPNYLRIKLEATWKKLVLNKNYTLWNTFSITNLVSRHNNLTTTHDAWTLSWAMPKKMQNVPLNVSNTKQ
jgi:hypothetical protein